MKRTLIPGLMLLAAFTLTNCSEQLAPPVQEDEVIVEETPSTEATEEEILGIPFEVYANASDEEVDTKTTNVEGGNYTAWEATDAIYVYHKPSNDSNAQFTKNYKFSMRNLDENLFGGALASTLEADKNYDWYFIYPNMEEDSGSAGTQSENVEETLVIGASVENNYVQTQNGANSKQHIQGATYPMFGSQNDVAGSTNPRVRMRHLSALVAIKLVNETGNQITIEHLELESATNPIVGEVKFNFSNDVPSITGNGTSSNVARLDLKTDNDAGINIQPSSEAKFYMGVAPVSDKFTIRVNGTAITKDLVIPLESGKVTTLKVKIPNLRGTQTTSIKKDGKDFVEWNPSTVSSTINGRNSTTVYSINNGDIVITGGVDDFLGRSSDQSALPISFYAASKVKKDSNGNLIENPATLSVSSIYMNVVNVVDFSFSGEDLGRKLGMKIEFTPALCGIFKETLNNIIVLDEKATYYYIDENKANILISSGLGNNAAFKAAGLAAADYNVDLFRSALFNMSQPSWKKLLDLAKVMAPGQFGATNGGTNTDLGNVLTDLAATGIKGSIYRAGVAIAISMATLEVKMTTNGDVALWGMNIQSQDTDISTAQ